MSESTRERARAARRLARFEITIGVASVLAAGLLVLARPAMTSPMFVDTRVADVPVAMAFFGITLGLARMLWIYLHDVLPAFDEDD